MVRAEVMKALAAFPRTPREAPPKCVSVLGLGRTGRAVALYMAEQGARVIASDASMDDSKDAPLREAGITLRRGENWVEPGDVVVISPGIRPHSALFKQAHALGKMVWSGPELFARLSGIPIIAVTGTDGKSTVTTWIADLLTRSGVVACAGGNLGKPMVSWLSEGVEMDVGVVEISAFQLQTTAAFSPAITLITNVVDDHLDYFQGSASDYRGAKRKLLELTRPGAAFIAPSWDPEIASWDRPIGIQHCPFHRGEGKGIRVVQDTLVEDGVLRVRSKDMHVQGIHNLYNGAMVVSVARLLDIPSSIVDLSLREYRPLPHRCEGIGTKRGVRFVNDSKATSPHAAMAAIQGVSGGVHVLMGGSEKGVSFQSLFSLCRQRRIRVYAYGETGPSISNGVGDLAEVFHDLAGALASAYQRAEWGDTILLSPACASFDQFSSFEERGDRFREWVGALSE